MAAKAKEDKGKVTGGGRNEEKLWIKGFGKKLTRAILKLEAMRYIGVINEGLSDEDRFDPKVYAWNLEYSVALVFGNSKDAKRFYDISKEQDKKFTWDDPLTEGPVTLRIVKDASFDRRLRGQIYHHLEVETRRVMEGKIEWNGNMVLDNNRPRGIFFVSNGNNVWELVRIDLSQRGRGSGCSLTSRVLLTTELTRRRWRSF